MSGDVLATIDDAVEGRCACGCGQPLDPDGPSGWFATEGCQWLWQRGHADEPVGPRIVIDVRAMAESARAVAAAARAMGEAFARVAREMAPAFEQLVKAGVIEKPLPADPMRRALELRRNRNTGPRREVRTPRRIDPRRSR